MPRFRGTIELHGKTATGIPVPPAVVEALGSHRKPPVRVTINGYTYRTTVATMAARFMVPLNAENRNAARVAAGDDVDIEIELDTEPRVVTIPDDFAEALDSEPNIRARFDELSYTRRKELVRSIEEAKTAATRDRRIGKALDELRK